MQTKIKCLINFILFAMAYQSVMVFTSQSKDKGDNNSPFFLNFLTCALLRADF